MKFMKFPINNLKLVKEKQAALAQLQAIKLVWCQSRNSRNCGNLKFVFTPLARSTVLLRLRGWGVVLLFFVAVPSASAITAICSPPPCANELTLQSVRTALQTVVAQEATLRQLVTISQTQLTLLQNQLAPAGAPGAFTSAYVPSTPLTVADCVPKNGNLINIPVAASVTTVCAQFNAAIVEFTAAQNLFNGEMIQLAAQFQALSTSPPTIYGVLSNSLQVQVLQGKQANLVGRHMANVTVIQKRLTALESDLARARGRFVFGGS
jgi:hypothetical protein